MSRQSPFDTHELPVASPGNTPPPPEAPPSKWKRHRTAIIAGAGGLLALIVLITAVVTFTRGPDEEKGPGTIVKVTGQEDTEAENNEAENEADDTAFFTKPPLTTSNVRDLIENTVGRFAFQGGTDIPWFRKAGAIKAFVIKYQGATGVTLLHELASFDYPQDAKAFLQSIVANDLESGKWDRHSERPLTIGDDPEGGQWALLTSRTNPGISLYLWTNGALYFSVLGPHVSARRFYDVLEY